MNFKIKLLAFNFKEPGARYGTGSITINGPDHKGSALRRLNAPLRVQGFLLSLTLLLVLAAQAQAEVSFNKDIRLILSENCFQCHGFDKNTRKAGLRLDVREEVITERDGIRAIAPGKPEESELVRRIFTEDEDDLMPPPESEKRLSDDEKELLKRWISEGAEYQKHWAYIAPERPRVPLSETIGNPVDEFIHTRLQEEGLQFNREADRVTLARRLSFDLTGLPPEPSVVERFAGPESDWSYEQLVDHFLNSPRFGERMAVYWLDLVRWADTMGFHSDDERQSTPYRDYVIDSFNSNKPFSQFTREQLAGDLFENPTTQQLVASGYNRMNQVTGEGGAQPKEYRAKYMADKTRNISSVWLGATMGCAECHDHKFDPYTAKDFYSMAAFFADLDEPDLVSYGRGSGIFFPAIQLDEDINKKLDEIEVRIEKLKSEGAEKDDIRQAEREREKLRSQGNWTVVSKQRNEPRTMRVLNRGNWMDESGPEVQPAIPEFFGKIVKEGRLDRMDLANWIASPENPLTARTFVNRLWYLYFGNGLSANLDDLGYQGAWPSHPELLDWLAVEFMDSGWDVKHVIRIILNSQAYKQSSLADEAIVDADPENRLYARQSSFRLAAEFVRDTALEISGLLTDRIGGESVKPYQPDGYWSDSYKSVGNPHIYRQDHQANLYRRGLYTFWKRTFLHPVMLTFDAPNREECVAQRPITNTPLQALILLNDPAFVEAARVFAQNILSNSEPSFDQRLNNAFMKALQRKPTSEEKSVFMELLEKHEQDFRESPESMEAFLTVGEYPIQSELDQTELAAWTSVCRVILNLHETIMRM